MEKISQTSLWLYSFLSGFKLFKSYKSKVMLVAFLGTHVPLLALLVYFVTSNSLSLGMVVRVLAIALLATLIGTAATLYALHILLAPVTLTSLSLEEYISTKKLPDLPTQFTDEAGSLMANTSKTLKQLDEVIHRMASYDDLTGLPNRVLFRDRLQQALSQTQRDNQLLAVALFSLDSLKDVNNALGHDAGDLLLRRVAQRLTTSVLQTAMPSRLSSNLFAVVQTELTSLESLVALSQTLLDVLSKPFSLDGNKVHVSASIGIAFHPSDSTHVDQLLQNASTAMEQAKRQGSGNYQFYSTTMNAQLQERLALKNELRYALERSEMLLHYQPRVDLHSGHVVAVEALLRWQHPTWGLISPAKFIPIAEESGLIVPIGEWVLRSACIQARAWQTAELSPLRMAVNLSARQFKPDYLVEMVAQILKDTGLNATYLELEVTESLMMENPQQSIVVLQQLHDLGITLALDDFGTGYSSLSYLRRFPIDILKIDQSFVRDVTSNSDAAAITQSIIALGKSLKLNITAEGVETQEQFEYLRAQGCDEIQGYYFSRPVPAVDLADLLKQAGQPMSM